MGTVRVVAVPDAASARRAAAREAAALLLAELAGLASGSVVISARCPQCGDEHGAPVASAGGWVSIAHPSPGLAVVTASTAGPVGVDAEPDTEAALRRAAEALPSSADPLRDWVRIEAVLKADGRGLRVEPTAVVVQGGRARVPGSDAVWAVEDLHLPGLVAALASPAG